jgi:uncharacterized membrane protein YdfJ with MMPL/SSD domain
MKFIQLGKVQSVLTRLGGILYRARWAVLLVATILVVAAAVFGTGIFGLLTGGGFQDPNSQSTHAQTLLDLQLGGASTDIVVLMQSDSLRATDPAFASAATQLLNTLAAQPNVASVTSYYSTHSSSFISRDGHETFAAIQLSPKDLSTKQNDYTALLPLLTSPTLHVTVGGNVPVNVAISKQISADLENAELLTFPILGILLFLIFRGLIAASLPLLVGGVAILGAFALLRGLTGLTDISVFAINVVTVLGLGLAIDYSLFMVTRFREELALDERDVRSALQRTLATAGRTVLFSGLTVSVSLLGLLLFPEGFLRSMGLGAIGAVLVAMIAALTILPAILALLGQRINALSIVGLFRRVFPSRRTTDTAQATGVWYRLSQTVMRFPVPVALVVLGVLVLLGLPFLHASFSTPDVRVLPQNQETRVVATRLAEDFPQQGASQLVIAIRTPGDALSTTNLASLDTYVRQIEAMPDVLQVQSLVTVDPALSLAQYQQLYANLGANPEISAAAAQLANGNATRVTVELRSTDFSAQTEDVVRQIRALPAPDGLGPLVGGETPYQMDLFANLRATLPYALLIMIVTIFVLLFLMTGSVVMPLKAIVLNTLSLTATFGALVWIFQDGHLENLLSFQSAGSIDGTQTILIFALAFGLSMDYEVFLLSRIKEQFEITHDNRASVAVGLQRTGWLITSAALLFAVVLAAFSRSEIVFIKEIGVGLAIAVLMDATLVRALLVPATMRLLGRWNWWAPAPLHALWRRIGLREGAAVPAYSALLMPEEDLEYSQEATRS